MSSRLPHEQKMKQLILESAVKITVEIGYDKLSMRKIADAIGYTPTTIYLYYKDKEQIVADISKEVYKKIINNITIILDENKNVAFNKQLELCFKVFIQTIVDNSEMGKAVFRSGTKTIFAPNLDSDLPEEDGIIRLQKLLLLGQQHSVFRKLDNHVAWMLISSLIGFSMNVIENRLHINENWLDLLDIYVDMLISGLLLTEGVSSL